MRPTTDPAIPRYAYATTDLDRAIAVVDLEEGKQVTTYELPRVRNVTHPVCAS
jgi:hypothetical protein